MDLKKIAFPDQLISSQRRKAVSPCSFGIVWFFIVLSALLFSVSSKGPFFQGLYNLGSHSNTSFASWRYPSAFGNNSSSIGCDNASSSGCNNTSVVQNSRFPVNETLEANATVISGGEEKVFESGNQTAKFEDVSFIVEGSVGGVERDARKGSQSVESGKGDESGAPPVGHSIDNEKNNSVGWKGDGVRGYMSENSTAKSVEIEHSSCGEKTESLDGVVGNCSSIGNSGAPAATDRSFKNCDIFNGRWVRDDTEPYYPPGSCPFIDKDFDCHLNGRPDSEYVKWRWQPYDCDIPRFNVTDFLERLRGKKLVFVGDSLNRNMWESLVCILRHGVADKSRVYEISGKHEFKKKGFYAFRFEDYDCTVDFVSSPFLVKESSFNGKNGSFETLRLDLMDATTSMYHDADVIIFNTGHWWTHEKTSRGEDYYQEGNYLHPRLKVLEAYKRALATWATWVEKNIDRNKTEVVFRGYSVTHFRGGPWNAGGQCNNETEPIMNDVYLAKYPAKMRILEYVLKDVKAPIVYLNISRLTDYRKDGHPSVYRPDYEAAQQEIHAQDCSHWCLPGVPDTWNELLYVSLLKSGGGSWRG
ncbi:trichome birefringence-like protein [Perilla frutescens var. hirtella]|uniref:Trichome birefringence-like protein n=1 Tax=Perilla frutescens var. hirtella TaxID=608512 RepID=A0AAD4J7E4_PERFH|nr:trichome birefringence-like protein [Perilla frutescens var. hirtella]